MTNYPDLQPLKFMVHDDGINAPIIHQHTIALLTAKLYPFYEDGTIPYEPLPEMMVGEYNSPVPDIILYDYATEQAQVIIEVAHIKGFKSDLKKIIALMMMNYTEFVKASCITTKPTSGSATAKAMADKPLNPLSLRC